MDDEVMIDMECAYHSTVAFTSSGSVYFWGYGLDGYNYFPSPVPIQGMNGKNVKSLSSTYRRAAFVTKSGELYTWEKLQGWWILLRRSTSARYTPKIMKVPFSEICKQVACSDAHFAVLTETGKVYTFGSGSKGLLGHGDESDRKLPSLVHALETVDIKQVVVFQQREFTTMALSTSGYVYAWGKDIDTVDVENTVLLPRIVDGLIDHNVVQVSHVYASHFAVLVDPSPSPIRQAQKAQFNNKQHSDVTFMVENEPIYGSKDVLSRKSEYFEAMFRSKMRESIEGVVVVPDVSAGVFLKMLEYLCLDDFFVLDDLDDTTREALCVLADMYLMEGLRLLLCFDHT